MPRPLTAMGRAHIATLPPFLRTSPEYEAVIHVVAKEIETLLEPAIETVRAQFNPLTADVLLPAWEYMVKLPVGGRGASIEQRRRRVLVRLLKVIYGSEGRTWEAELDALVGPGWDYADHDPDDMSSPPVYTVRIALPFPPDAEGYLEALREVREITAAHLEIEFSSGAGFIVDESHVDLEGLGV